MIHIKRSGDNERLRRFLTFCAGWIGRIHSWIAFGFLWGFRKSARLLSFIPWNFRAAMVSFLAAGILVFAGFYGRQMLLLCNFMEAVPAAPAGEEEVRQTETPALSDEIERINPDDEFSEQKLSVDLPGGETERFAFFGQLNALRKAHIETINPDRKAMKPDAVDQAYEKRFTETGLNKSNLFYSPVQLNELFCADAFRSLDAFGKAAFGIAAFLLLCAVLSCLACVLPASVKRIIWRFQIFGTCVFALYWLILIVPMFLLPDTLLSMNRQDFDGTMRNLIWFTYLWFWMPVLAFSFFSWFPFLLSGCRQAYGFEKRKVEPGDLWAKNLTCQGENPGFYRGGYWAFSYHFFILLVIPLLAHGCYQNDSYEIPQGDGGGAVEVTVKKIKPKPKKKKKRYVFNPNSAISFAIPEMDSQLSDDLDEQTVAEVYQTTQMTIGPGKKGGKAGWPDGMANGRIRFIRLEYRGGDWDQDMGKGADYNMLLKMKEYAGFNIADDTEAISIDRLSRWKVGKAPPFVYITGSGKINVNAQEAKQIRRYLLETGGMLFADNGGGNFDYHFRNMLRQILPELELIDISNDDEIYQAPFAFPDGAPPLFHHSGNRALGLKYNGRWIVFYHQGDINDAWKTGGSGLSPDKQELAFKMGANVIAYSFTQYLAQVRRARIQK